VSQAITVSPTVTTTFTVYGTGTNGCIGSAPSTITIKPAPALSVSGPSAVCTGNSLTLTANGSTSYNWSNGSSGSSLVLTPSITSTISVTGTGTNNCTRTVTRTITVEALPNVIIIASNNVVCSGTSVTLTATGANNYVWQPLNSTSQSVAVAPTSATIYTLTGTTVNGCVGTSTIQLTINSLPVVSINAPSSICSGYEAILTASGAGTYTWSNGSNGQTTTVIPVTGNSTFSVAGASGGCTGTQTVTISVDPSPTVQVSTSTITSCAGMDVTLTANGALTYSWNTSDTTAAIVVAPVVTTVYTVTGFGSNGCGHTIAYTHTVTDCTDIDELTLNNTFNIYPNPNNGSFVIAALKGHITVFDGTGREIMNTEIFNSQPVNITGLAKGFYLVAIQNGNKTTTKKIIVN
jgi:hypothetical protein